MTTEIEERLYDDMDTIAEIAEAGLSATSDAQIDDAENALRRIKDVADMWEDPQ